MMDELSKTLDDGRIHCRVMIRGSYKDKPFFYVDPPGVDGSQFVHPDSDDEDVRVSKYWWSDHNMSCDCNRARFLGATPETHPELFESYVDEDGDRIKKCGKEIRIHSVIPLDYRLPELWLDEPDNKDGV
jgi:hypothetical protein